MIKLMTGAACALMMLAASAPASAQDDDDYTFTLANSSDMAIITFHLVAKGDDSWSEDLIPDQIIASGDTLDLEFSPAEDECEYATAVTMEDGTVYADVIDYCGITGVEVDDQNGLTTY